jgi:hypothetical protein
VTPTVALALGVALVAAAAIAGLSWWINVGSARRHWRQAHEKTVRDFRQQFGPDWTPPE